MNTDSYVFSSATVLIAVVGLGIITAGCELPDLTDVTEERPETVLDEDFEVDGDPDAGHAVYQQRCATCHGDEGEGDGPAGVGMQPPPTDFTAVVLEPQRAYVATRDGGRALGLSPGMPAFRDALSEQELHDVVAYTLEIGDSVDEPTAPQQPDQAEEQPPAEPEAVRDDN